MPKKINIKKEELERLIFKENFTIWNLIDKYNCGITTIENYVKKFDINTPEGFYKKEGSKTGRPKGFKMSEEQKELRSNMFSGEGNPFYGKKHSEKTKIKMSENHADISGDKNPFKKSLENPEKLKEHKERCQAIWDNRDEEYREKFSQKLSNAIANSDSLKNSNLHKNHKSGHYESKKCGKIFYRSSWELKLCQLLDIDESVERYTVEEFCLDYTIEEKIRTLKIDFMIYYKNNHKLMIEVKPLGLQEFGNNPFKIKAMNKYCKENNIDFKVFSKTEIDNYEKELKGK